VFFFDEDNQIIIRDKHSDVSTSFKFMRGYYPTRPVSRIVIVPKFFQANMFYPALFREAYGDHLARLENLQAFPLEDYHHTANTVRFKTNYAQSRFIVLNTAYDPGWRVERIDAQGKKTSTPVYLSQGGFVGFLSGVGETDYVVRYWTPYLTEGLLISLAGVMIFGGIVGASQVVIKKRLTDKND
jgi:uncharacterized membrane protein YfhO